MTSANYFGALLSDSYSYDIPISATIKTIPTITKTPTVLQPAVNASVLPTANLSAINVSSVVLDEYGEPLPYANISVNGVPKIQTNFSGTFNLQVAPSDVIKVTYVGLREVQFTANTLPKQIQMNTTAEQLEGVVVKPKTKPVTPTPTTTKPTNWLLLIGLGVGAIVAFKKFGSKKVVKATI